MFNFFRSHYRCFITGALTVLATSAASGQSTEPSEALLQDAASYVEIHGGELDEAVRRLELQREIGDLDATLAGEERGTFAGLWIEHEPDYRVIVRFTDSLGEERLKSLVGGTALEKLVEVRPALWSLAELEERQAVARHLAGELGVAVDTDINVFENRVEVYTVDAGVLRSGLTASGLRLPRGAEIVPVARLAEPHQQVLRGGDPLSTCTGGFTVLGGGELGISTAAHCGNTQSFQGTLLPFRNEDQQGNQDVQWHTAPCTMNASNDFNSGIGFRACTGTRHRNNQVIGSQVCKWGMTTGRTCGDIQSKNNSLWYVTNSASTFIRVAGGNTNLSSGGDSGGPWFVETTAYGIHSGGLGNDAFYMPINYISTIGAAVLTFNPGPNSCPPPPGSGCVQGASCGSSISDCGRLGTHPGICYRGSCRCYCTEGSSCSQDQDCGPENTGGTCFSGSCFCD